MGEGLAAKVGDALDVFGGEDVGREFLDRGERGFAKLQQVWVAATGAAHGTALEMTMEMTKRLEAMVEEYPEQWFWIHRRWKPERHGSIADP